MADSWALVWGNFVERIGTLAEGYERLLVVSLGDSDNWAILE